VSSGTLNLAQPIIRSQSAPRSAPASSHHDAHPHPHPADAAAAAAAMWHLRRLILHWPASLHCCCSQSPNPASCRTALWPAISTRICCLFPVECSKGQYHTATSMAINHFYITTTASLIIYHRKIIFRTKNQPVAATLCLKHRHIHQNLLHKNTISKIV